MQINNVEIRCFEYELNQHFCIACANKIHEEVDLLRQHKRNTPLRNSRSGSWILPGIVYDYLKEA